MKKIVSNILVVGSQLMVGGLFLCMLFSDSNENNKVVVSHNDNLNKMADAVSELFVVEQMADTVVIEDTTEVDLLSEEERKAHEEADAKKKAEEEAAAAAEEAARVAAEEEAKKNAISISASGYISKPGMGFNVTTGNKIYSLTTDELNIVSRVVSCEAGNKDDALAVMSVILNRSDSCYGGNCDPVSVVAASGQFSCYKHNNGSTSMESVVKDALNGIRNNNYKSFNCPNCSPYIANYIVDGGNWFYG